MFLFLTIPSSWGICGYNPTTSNVTRSDPDGISPMSLVCFKKSFYNTNIILFF